MGNTLKCGKSQKSVPIRITRKRKSQYIQATPCKYCTHSFSDKRIRDHEKRCHRNPSNVVLQCDNCSRKFSEANYERHVTACDSKYTRTATLRTTSFINDEVLGTKTYCEFCEEAIGIEVYVDHMKRCRQNPKNIRAPCPFCKDSFASDLLMKHKVFCAKNPENLRVVCYGCKKEIKGRHYQIHLRECQDLSRQFSTQPEIECPICLCEIKQSDSIRALACRHKYHTECIIDWSKKRNTCPICQAKIKFHHHGPRIDFKN